ncbi:hypothetical protein BDV96DRAFT_563274 [Lophiotrema nucula]|uniref:Fermentation associated protein n=1 Tax=Lophiotrema nucula TaxID=690887 RepID=A0A6A5ZTJ8_9PLEO|nr:hypothetical protein BDV96DRAFT_563274 [Lophiotrema nucula]
MADGTLIGEPLNPHNGFNWVFLVELLISGILTIFFLFYFNRLFATLVSYGIRAYTWRAYHAYIDIQALQISLLGGRLFFKDIRYHAHNETIFVHGGYITWRYWMRKVRDADIYAETGTPVAGSDDDVSSTGEPPSSSRSRNVDKAEKGGKETQKKLPCRISIKVEGVEAFMYNRSPAYDGIIEAMQRNAHGVPGKEEKREDGTSQHVRNGSVASSAKFHDEKEHSSNKLRKTHTTDGSTLDRVDTNRSTKPMRKPDLPAFLRVLPIRLDCNKGAIVVGNEHTSSVITAQFEKASGEIDASSCGPLDVYQQAFHFQFTHPVINMKPNPDFKSYQLETALRMKQEEDSGAPEDTADQKHNKHRKSLLSWLPKIPNLFTLFSRSSDTDSIHTHPMADNPRHRKSHAAQMHLPGQDRWKGLTRYLDESQDDGHGEWDGIEYAKTSLIADCPCINVSFYWDQPGPVPNDLDNSVQMGSPRPNDINGSIPPEYGMDLQIFGGTINYGPWADRHRAVFQNIFFPGNHVDAVPASPLAPGDLRVLTVFKLYLSIEDDTVLRIPVREPSKDWRWKGKAHTLAGQDNRDPDKAKAKGRTRRKSMRAKRRDKSSAGSNVRPFAWIDVKVAGNSSVNYVMDMVASDKGYQNKLDVDIVSSEISSSVNHGLLWRSGAIGLDCDLGAPLGWNTLRKWLFNITCKDLELFLLRDHMFLLVDLVADWGSGPPSDYFTFVPFQYLLNISFVDFKLYLNTNDSNIVNNPADLEDNSFIIMYGKHLHGDVTIPLDKFRPLQNEISFDVSGREFGLEMSMPPKSTLDAFVKSKNVAQLGGLTLKGNHTYMTETSAMNTDRLFMDIRGDRLSLELYGFLIRHFMKIKDNYFGDDMHFKTLEEFQGLPSQRMAADSTTPQTQPFKITNDLDVILSISAEHSSVFVPANLYSIERGIRADLAFANADLRFTNYYMDLVVNFSPITVSLSASVASSGLPNHSSGQTELFVESVVICGHRLFGLPPTEPTYVCNWDFDVGPLSGECTSDFIENAAGVARSFAFTFDDDENTLPIANPIVIHDTTFLRLKTHDIHIWLHIAKEAILISSGPISLDFNDLAGPTFSQRLNLRVPNLSIGAVDAKSASRHRTRQGEKQMVETHAFLQSTISLTLLNRKLGFSEERDKQQQHMQEHDQRTHRTQYLFIDHDPSSIYHQSKNPETIRPPAMQYPDVPHPIFLFKPNVSGSSSSLSSRHSSDHRSHRGRPLRPGHLRSASAGSLAHSIRSARKHRTESDTVESSRSRTLLARSVSRVSSERLYVLPSEEERMRRNLPPSSVALSSPLAAPYFPLDQVQPDVSDVPSFPTLSSGFNDKHGDAMLFNDVSTRHLDESFDHTSLLIDADPGIRLLCTPESVRCVSNLLELVNPHRPEDLLDEFQVNVMTQILDRQKRREGKGNSLDFNIRIPFIHIRFLNAFGPQLGNEGGKDQYDVTLHALKLAARIKKFPAERANENSLAIYTTLGSLGVSITERSVGVPSSDVAVQAEITELLVWVLKSKETSINVSFRGLEAATASKKIEYLASLIHRSTLLGNELAYRFEEVSKQQQGRLRYLAWFLTSVQEEYSDPAFLTRPTYALRAARDHLRTHDSWKIISRFRYIWQSLPEDEKAKVLGHCSQSNVRCPDNIEQEIIDMWDQWRTWDIAHVKKSLAMRTLFGVAPNELPPADDIPLHLDIRSALVKLIVDPGPSQSEAAWHMLAVNVELVPPEQPSGLMLVDTEMIQRSTIVQISSKDTSIRVSWEICELIELLVKMFEKDTLKRAKEPPAPTSMKALRKVASHDIQVVYVSEGASITLDTINLRGTSLGRKFQVSVAMSDQNNRGLGETITVLVHMQQGITELRSRAKRLVQSQFHHPSVYIARRTHGDNAAMPDELKIAGASRKIELRVEQDILGFLEVIDSVLRDEVAYFYEKVTVMQKSLQNASSSDKSKTTSQLPNITLALLMDEYSVDLALLQSLTWSIAGSFGRISVVPALGKNVRLRIDYDLDSHIHRMHSTDLGDSNIISSLELPPLNGRLNVTNTEKETRIQASGIIETIQLQASEIQALLSIINKPEISRMFYAVVDDIDALKAHVEEIFPPAVMTPAIKTPKSSREVVFNVQMTLSGLNILASAPGHLPDSAAANLAVKLASVQLKATNIDADGTIFLLPEVTAQLQQISVEMTLSDSTTVRRCGNLTFGATFQATADEHREPPRRVYRAHSSGLEVNIFADTASAVVDIVNHLQDKIKDLDLSKEKRYFKRLRHSKSKSSHRRDTSERDTEIDSVSSGALFTSTYSVELQAIQVSWIVGNSIPAYAETEVEDLVLSFKKIDFNTKKDDVARLTIEDMQLQMVPVSVDKTLRSANSALLPEVVFNVAYSSGKDIRKVAFQAAGKSLDLRLDSRFILPANVIERSITLASKKFRAASATWNMTPTTTGAQRKNPFGNKRMASLLVDASFAGAVVHINGSDGTAHASKTSRSQQKGRYSQFVGDSHKSSMALRAPGVALKVEYKDDGQDPSLNGELKVDGSSNTLYPTVVPLLIDISNSIKEVVSEKEKSPAEEEVGQQPPKPAPKILEEDNLITADPSALLGRTQLNIGLRICRQDFSLSCQPIARVAAIAKLEDIYVTVNSVKSQDHGHFFAVSAAFEKLQVTVQHVYSRESTFGFDVESIVLSLMNSKHLSGTSGISAILKINPTALQINARQLQDFLLFREIWLPPEIRQSGEKPSTNVNSEPQEYLMQRYQQVTAATAFPWHANIAIADIKVDLDLGQAIGKTSFHIINLWASTKKAVDWEQNLCIGVGSIGVDSTGRTSGFVELADVRVRTSISWPSQSLGIRQTPLVQASLGFRQLRVKAGFDYQPFAIADIANFNFLMYNVREQVKGSSDRLVAILDGDKIHVFCTATSAAQGLALFQAIERLIQENEQAYKQSLKDIEKFLRRKSSVTAPFGRSVSQSMISTKREKDDFKAPISLHTDVVVTLRSINVGIFPSTFADNQVLMLEAADAQARFAVALERGRIHSGLGMTLGQLSVALSSVPSPKRSKSIGELTVEDVVESIRSARGGTILRVPKVLAQMQTWQGPDSNHIDYIFKSSFEGKVDVGWNFNRVSYIRTMWSNHSRTLASRLGKPLPESAVKITSSTQPNGPSTPIADPTSSATDQKTAQNTAANAKAPLDGPSSSPPPPQNQEKITAVVNVPQSRYEYTPLEPPLIETPQLRDMGEATPPLEWIGLHRDRLPNVTHQIVIVTLLEVAREVEDAYERILGSS